MRPDRELALMRVVLLRGRPEALTPDDGLEAFERHQLLAIRFHRAARLNAPGLGERAAWRQFFHEHFPRGDDPDDLLWERWRIALLKDEYPGPGVAISHGQPHAHWKTVDPGARLFINLESMWDDFGASVESLIRTLERDPDRRKASVEWFQGRSWHGQLVSFVGTSDVVASSIAASATGP